MWVITKDLLFEEFGEEINGKSEVGRCSRNYDGSKLPFIFRVKDDDGEIYYHGRASSCNDCTAFAPLDDFAKPNDGATTIEYYDKTTRRWEEL